MSEKRNHAEFIEQEITKQIDEFDKRFNRGGFLSLALVVIAIFIIGFWIISFFKDEEDKTTAYYYSQFELIEYIETLEAQIDDLDERIYLLEEQINQLEQSE